MFTATCRFNRWQVSRKNIVVLSGLGSIETARQIAELYGIVISNYSTQSHLRIAA